ncbi:hypothetical protein AeMF1_009816 [Aphanomyces euteiches]|nr:hypothetical protein AeMF1_009816 [Aphanomyces euteiches]
MAGDAATATAAAGQPARIHPAPGDFQEWLAKHDVEASPEKSDVSATSPIFLDSHVLRLHEDQLDDNSSSGNDGGHVELPQRSTDDGRDKGNDDDLMATIDWNLDAFDMSDKLCQEIQSAVDAATTRLATEKEPPLLPSSPPDLVLIMEVVIGDGRTETIHVHEGDSAETLASAFATAHNLERDVVPTLVQHIHDQIQRMDASCGATGDALGRKTPSSNQAERHYNALLDKFGKKNKANAATSSRQMSSSLEHGKPLGNKAARASRTPSSSSVASERLYALAAAQREWLERAQKKKQDEVERELADNKVRLADKTKQLVANRTNGQYRSIGERLHGEALVDHAKRQQQLETHAAELALGPLDVDKDWMCPKCAFMNRIVDAKCQNTFVKGKPSKASPSKSIAAASKPKLPSSSSSAIKGKSGIKTKAASQASPPPSSICGQPKPPLFHPTLVSKESKKPSQDDQFVLWRQRHKQAAQAEYAERHPFTPQVNPTSTELVKDKRPSNPHAALYADADARRERHHVQVHNFMAQFPFRPDIGVNTFVPPSGKPDELFHKLAIQDRDKLDAARAKLHAKYSAAKDPATGRPYFKPETGRAPQFARNDTGLPIGEFLYNSRREFDQVHRQRRHAHMTSLKEERSQSFMSKASRTHLKQRKAKSFDRIFTLLQDASASTATVAKDDNVLDPRLLDMDALSLELGHVALSLFDTCGWVPIAKDNFHTAMDATLAQCRHLTNTQVLFFSDKSSSSSARTTTERLDAQNDAEMTFRPAICAKSTKIAKEQARDATKVFDTMFKYHETYNAKRKQLEKQLQAQAAKTCTFRPKVNATSGKFQDMYARLPEDFDPEQDAAAVVLSTAKSYSRPYVRPIENSPRPSSSASSDATN